MKKISIALFVIGIISIGIYLFINTKNEYEYINHKFINADFINQYFSERNMPLAGMGEIMVEEAEKNGLDWRLLPAIAIRESSGGKYACKKNPFGWASCHKTFDTWEDAIKTVAKHLGGNVSSTETFYKDKTTEEKLKAYNPPTIVPAYSKEVMHIMELIGPEDNMLQ